MIVVGLSLSHQFQRLDITDRRWTNLRPWPPRAPRDVIRTAIDTRRNRIVRGLDGISREGECHMASTSGAIPL